AEQDQPVSRGSNNVVMGATCRLINRARPTFLPHAPAGKAIGDYEGRYRSGYFCRLMWVM
ncbi:MAG: hypothetical protein M3346_04245, partial [Actinomycetota bacterium]|nr:hypothetical protein [Actinomycetota bacterium]